ncbi:MAG: T9SS type A sorting domain-containing protein, partial [Chitinophagales bacterium]
DKTVFTTLTSSLENETAEAMNISIYPSPANEVFSIASNNPIEEIQIADMQGRIIYSKILSPPAYSIKVEAGNWHSGVYFIHMQTAEKSVLSKIVLMDSF